MYQRVKETPRIKILVIIAATLLNVTVLSYQHIDTSLKSIKQDLRDECHIIVSSGDRSKEHNKKVGGAKNSYHLQEGRARDINTNCPSDFKRLSSYYGLSIIIYKSHIHVDNRESQICLVKTKPGFRACKVEDIY